MFIRHNTWFFYAI